MPDADSSIICPECAAGIRLRSSYPCPRHPDHPRGSYLPADERGFLYDSTLLGNEIRLIKFEKGSADGEINCKLIITPLTETLTYTALSYCWGDQTVKRKIICNEKYLDVGENLFIALSFLKPEHENELLWVDALCINQADIEEKTVQVTMMRNIYEQATLVISWLGLKEDTDEQGFSLMKRIHEKLGEPAMEESPQMDYTPLSDLGLPATEDPDWKSMVQILYRPYFYRIWIVQEVLVARKAIAQCGTYVVDLDLILGLAKTIQKYHHIADTVRMNVPGTGSEAQRMLTSDNKALSKTMNVIPSLSYSAGCLWYLRWRLAHGDGPYMLELLNNTRQFKATDPRDKIFAIANLAQDIPPTVIRSLVNYNKSLSQVQIDLAIIFLQCASPETPMMFSYIDAMHHSDDLPSWVPDWTSGGPIQASLAATYYLYKPTTFGVVPRHLHTGNRLILRSKVFDCVASVVDKTPYMIPTTDLLDLNILTQNMQDMEAWEDACWDLAQALETYPTGERVYEAYWRTLMFNSEQRGKIAGSDMAHCYGTWASTFGTFNELTAMARGFAAADAASANAGSSAVVLWPLRKGVSLVTWTWRAFKMGWVLGKLRLQLAAGARFEASFKEYNIGRKFFTTEKGYMGWVPIAAQKGDYLCYFEELHLPFVVRKADGGFRVIGDAYVHGLMYEYPPELDEAEWQVIMLL